MAILKLHWQIIHQTLETVVGSQRRMAILGYPDFLVDQSVLAEQYPQIDQLPIDQQAESTKRKHRTSPNDTV